MHVSKNLTGALHSTSTQPSQPCSCNLLLCVIVHQKRQREQRGNVRQAPWPTRTLLHVPRRMRQAGAAGSQRGESQAPLRVGSYGGTSRRSGPPASGSRAAALVAFVQEQAAGAGQGLAGALEARLHALPATAGGSQSVIIAEQALLIGGPPSLRYRREQHRSLAHSFALVTNLSCPWPTSFANMGISGDSGR